MLLNYMYMLMFFLEVMILVLISVAFLTLLERKVLGYMQMRKGPNKVGIMGMLQPFSDGMKLFIKEIFYLRKSNYWFYLISPMMSMLLMFCLWFSLPFWVNLSGLEMHILMILCVMSLSVYVLMLSGWSSNSSYAITGSLRGIAQTISYEVSMIFIMFSVMLLVEDYNLLNYHKMQYYSWFILLLFPASVMLYISFLAEMNRTPFDFSEGESELVSGFNVEYMSGPFALLFIAEYGMILFMSYMFSMLFLGGNIYCLMFYLGFILILISVIWFRGTFPRIRYDMMMNLVWKDFLPSILLILIILMFLKSMMLNYMF